METPNIVCDIKPGRRLIVAFTGFQEHLDTMDFEFGHALKDVKDSKVFVRNRSHVWYHNGISDEINTIPKLREHLAGLIRQAQPSHMTFVGASAGGYAAILFGHFLKAHVAHAFGPQTFLDRAQNEAHGIFGHPPGEGEGIEYWYPELCNTYALGLPPEDCFYDLKDYIRTWNGITRYYIHVSNAPEENDGAKADHIYAEHLSDCEGVSVVRYPCSGHSCAGFYLKSRNQLTRTLTAQ